MFDLKDCSDTNLVQMREELLKTRANAIEQLAVIATLLFKIAIDREFERRRAEAAAPAKQAAAKS